MKNYILLLLFLVPLLSFSQRRIYTDKLNVSTELNLNDYIVKAISNDSIITIADSLTLVTQMALKNYVTANSVTIDTVAEIATKYDLTRPSTKNWSAFGDSFSVNKTNTYIRSVIDKMIFEFDSVYVHGVSGSNIIGQVDSLDNLLAADPTYFDDKDYVTLLLGPNDYAGNVVLGTIDSTVNSVCFAGKLKYFIETVQTANPKIELYIMTPTKANSAAVKYTVANSAGWFLSDLAELISEVCYSYSVPVINLYSAASFNLQTLPTLTTDNLHPSAEGKDVISDLVVSAFKSKKTNGFFSATDGTGIITGTANRLPYFSSTTELSSGAIVYDGDRLSIAGGNKIGISDFNNRIISLGYNANGSAPWHTINSENGYMKYNWFSEWDGTNYLSTHATLRAGMFDYSSAGFRLKRAISTAVGSPITWITDFSTNNINGQITLGAYGDNTFGTGTVTTIPAFNSLHQMIERTPADLATLLNAGNFSRTGTNTFLSNSADNVGIGISTPAHKLDVQGTARILSVLTLNNRVAHNPTSAAQSYYYMGFGGLNKSYWGTDASFSGGNDDDYIIGAAGQFFLYSNNTKRAVFNTVGDFGIGTLTPNVKLDVVGGSIRTDSTLLLPKYGLGNKVSGSYSYVLAGRSDSEEVGEYPLSALSNYTYDNSLDGGVDLVQAGATVSAKLSLDSLTADPSPVTSTTYLVMQTGAFSAKKILIDNFMVKAMDEYNDSLEVVEAASPQAAQTASTSTVGEEFWFRITGETGLTKMRKE